MSVKHTKDSQYALQKAKEFGLRLTSGYRSPEHHLSKKNPNSDHIKGQAYDFAGSFANMKKLAQHLHATGRYKQIIFENKDYRTGRYIGGHMNHVHVSWHYPAKGGEFSPINNEKNYLEEGEEGGLIETIQKLLGNLTIDGIFGEKTKAAVENFQKENNLTVDGLVGKNTWEKLTQGGYTFFLD